MLRDLRPLAHRCGLLVLVALTGYLFATKSPESGLGGEPSTSPADRAASLLCLVPQSMDEEVEGDATVTELRFRSFSVGERSVVFTAYEFFGGENGADVEIDVPLGLSYMRASSVSHPVRMLVGSRQTLKERFPSSRICMQTPLR